MTEDALIYDHECWKSKVILEKHLMEQRLLNQFVNILEEEWLYTSFTNDDVYCKFVVLMGMLKEDCVNIRLGIEAKTESSWVKVLYIFDNEISHEKLLEVNYLNMQRGSGEDRAQAGVPIRLRFFSIGQRIEWLKAKRRQ